MLNKYEFSTYSGSEYVYFPDSNIVLGKKYLNSNKDRYENILKLNKEKYNIETNYTGAEIKNELLQSGFTELAIEVTSQCNFRCKYCVYSGQYSGQRVHETHNMDDDTAKKSIELYFKYIKEGREANPNRRPVVAFYGGEPLVNFKLVKECVEYAKELYKDKIFFSITTNASLLTDEIIDFLVKEEFSVVVSLDGYKENHDRNRVNVAGIGTFDIVMKNINKLYEKQGSPVFISSVFDYKTDFEKMEEFFNNNPHLVELAINGVNPNNTNYYEKFSEEDYKLFKEKLDSLQEKFIENVKEKKYSFNTFMNRIFGDICTSYFMKQIDLSLVNSKVVKYTGACIPGSKLFVDYTGNFYICEKTNREVSIGNINDGLDFDKCADIVNRYNKAVVKKCSKCLLRSTCKRCFTSIAIKNEVVINSDICKEQIESFKNNIKFVYSIFELNPIWVGTYFNEYYDTIRELAVILK
ncbi:uncharacterized protein SAMN04487886_107017 [Clostridium sp. DSM 8431]|uniref:radical SAM protein n=1 Tax=Clostridium sp. DSM 8431 TaxID=1761781 RepID=UPI0008EB8846|nr:radical SAM protein [Clostridium sp. DSM 8431]SFU59948.1 uncharacterized protein SAMN04487886_107017 [Clostridium sp. DSM 8431]